MLRDSGSLPSTHPDCGCPAGYRRNANDFCSLADLKPCSAACQGGGERRHGPWPNALATCARGTGESTPIARGCQGGWNRTDYPQHPACTDCHMPLRPRQRSAPTNTVRKDKGVLPPAEARPCGCQRAMSCRTSRAIIACMRATISSAWRRASLSQRSMSCASTAAMRASCSRI